MGFLRSLYAIILIPPLDKVLSSCIEKYANYYLGELEKRFKEAQMIVYESIVAIFLFKICKTLAPEAKDIYRVSDDMRPLHNYFQI